MPGFDFPVQLQLLKAFCDTREFNKVILIKM